VATVERNLKKVEGVDEATVNLSSERATVSFDPQLAGLDDLIGRVRRAGYDVATGQADLDIQGLSDSNDALRLERALSQLEGVVDAQVIYGSQRATVKYIPTVISQSEIRKTVSQAGFSAVELGGEVEDAERLAREAEIARQRHLLIVGLVFTIPLFILAMARDLGLLPMSIAHSPWVNWVLQRIKLSILRKHKRNRSSILPCNS